MKLKLCSYLDQIKEWPKSGRHIMAQYDEESIWVYQAYRSAIGQYATAHQKFGGEFSYNRMSWIKPNFLWMMYRSGWASKEGQEVILAIRLKREAFDQILAEAVHSSFVQAVYGDTEFWKRQLASSEVRLQWDPDHNPQGNSMERRAIQLGLRGSILKSYGTDWILEIQDISQFVVEQRNYISDQQESLMMPHESVYYVEDQSVVTRLGIDELVSQKN